MSKGYLALVFHAHLPYIRHREEEEALEERWLFEAISESYVPLLKTFEELDRDGVDFRMTVSLSPTLIMMLDDVELMSRYRNHLLNLLELAEKEVEFTQKNEPDYHHLALFYQERYESICQLMNSCNWYILDEFRKWKDKGKLELITSCATHGFLPLMKTEEAIRAQIELGLREFERVMGYRPRGIWLPECAYTPGVDRIAKECGVDYFFVESHTVEHATPTPMRGIHAPLESEYGVIAFPRDKECSAQVWSSQEGYPGDPDYREYYRDIGFYRDHDYIAPHIHSSGIRLHTGMKYHRITGKSEHKEPYNIGWALEKAASHAGHFLHCRIEQANHLNTWMDRTPLVVAPYDAELFGHWWFEGPQFINYLFRKIYFDQEVISLITPSEYLQQYPVQDTGKLPMSTWGRNGYAEVWLEGKNDWIYRHLHQGERKLIQLVERFGDSKDSLVKRSIKQAARELLLAQSSDWPFIMENQTTTQYAVRRFKQHMNHFNTIFEHLVNGKVPATAYLESLEEESPVFQNLDLDVYRPKKDEQVQKVIPVQPGQKRVLMLSWEYPPKLVGGLARAVGELAEELVQTGHQVHVLTSSVEHCPPYEVMNGVHVHRIPTLLPEKTSHFPDWIFTLNLGVMDYMRKWTDQGMSFDLIHCHDWLLAEAAIHLKHHYQWPLIATIHATEHGRHQGLHNNLQRNIHHLEWKLTYEAARVIVCSQYMKQEVQNLFQLPADKIDVIPNGYRKEAPSTLPLPKWVKPNPEEKLVIYVGRMVREKGLEELLYAIPHVLYHHPQTRFVLAGKGPMLDYLRNKTYELGIADRVHLPGFISDELRQTLTEEAYCTVIPSLYEPFGIVALEAMSVGTPVIVSDTGGLSEIVDHGRNGLKVYPGNVESLQTQLTLLLNDPHWAKEIGHAGQRSVETHYQWNRIAEATSQSYSKVMHPTHAKQRDYVTNS